MTDQININARKIQTLHTELKLLKAEIFKSPVRVGTALSPVGWGNVHLAYCDEVAPEDDVISCHLDTDVTGDLIDVNCILFGTVKLSECLPLLIIGKPIFVSKIAGDWWSVWWYDKWC